jgi:hypothetical protein
MNWGQNDPSLPLDSKMAPDGPSRAAVRAVMGFRGLNIDGLVKSPKTVMPDLIRHPEVIGFTGFRLSPE